jgi:hypothetical protein
VQYGSVAFSVQSPLVNGERKFERIGTGLVRRFVQAALLCRGNGKTGSTLTLMKLRKALDQCPELLSEKRDAKVAA